MIYGASSVCWWVMCLRSSGGAWPATRDGGGRGGASAFPARGRRTWIEEARMSIVGVWGCVSRTQFGWRQGGRWSSMVRWTSDSFGEQRHGVVSIPAKGSQRLDQSGSEGWRGGRGSFWALGFGRGGAAAANFGGQHGGRLGGFVEEEREKQQEGRARIGLYRGTSCCTREGEGEQMRGQAQVDGRRCRAPWACVAATRHTRPGVACEREPAEVARAVEGVARRHVA
jgi:hypothetical protein